MRIKIRNYVRLSNQVVGTCKKIPNSRLSKLGLRWNRRRDIGKLWKGWTDDVEKDHRCSRVR